jgi:hypothetical protein
MQINTVHIRAFILWIFTKVCPYNPIHWVWTWLVCILYPENTTHTHTRACLPLPFWQAIIIINISLPSWSLVFGVILPLLAFWRHVVTVLHHPVCQLSVPHRQCATWTNTLAVPLSPAQHHRVSLGMLSLSLSNPAQRPWTFTGWLSHGL